MHIGTCRTVIVCLVILLAFTSQAPAAGEAQGRLYDARGGWKELFPWCTRVGDGKMAGNFTDMGGYFLIGNLEPGTYVFGFSRRFGLGPVISTPVAVEEGKTSYVCLLKSDPYRASGRRSSQPHRRFAQGFIASGECVRRVQIEVDSAEKARLVYAIHEGGPDGPRVGAESGDGTWEPGQVLLRRGVTYFFTVRRQDDQPFRMSLAEDGPGQSFADGRPIPEADLGGRVVTDRDGIIVSSFPAEGELYGPCEERFGQTFVARGTSLAMVDFVPAIGGGRREGSRYTVRVLESGPGGAPVGATRLSSGSDMMVSAYHGFELRCALWGPGEVPLIPGRTYYLEVVAAQGPFRISTHDGRLLGGSLYRDGKPVEGKCLDAVIIEYEPDDSPPPPIGQLYADLAGTSVQLSFDVPEDMDISQAAVSRSSGSGPASELAVFSVCPGRTEIFVDRSPVPGHHYQYEVVLVDAAGNRSTPVARKLEVKPLTPDSNLLVNGDFVARAQASGGVCPGWDTARLDNGVLWSMSRPKDAGGFYSLRCWQEWRRYDVVAFQQVPVRKGQRLLFAADTLRKEPFNNGDVNEVTLIGIDPLGRTDPAADSVVWSAAEFATQTWTTQAVDAVAQSDVITVYLRARALQPGQGMEAGFAKARLNLLPALANGGAK